MSILTVDDFRDKQGESFEMIFADGTLGLTLTKITALPNHDYAGKIRDPFSLFFDGTPGVLCPQAIYLLRHQSGWEAQVFLVPVAGTPDNVYTYQAVFN